MRLNSLVIQKFSLSAQPLPMPAATVEIVGRSRGILAFLLSLIGFSPITRFTLAGNELRCQSASLFGQSSQTIPINQISTLSAGVRKPVENLVGAAVFLFGGIGLGISNEEWTPFIFGLVLAIVLVVGYVLTKSFFIKVYPEGGPEIALEFKPNVIEGVPIDVNRALSVIGVIRDMVLYQETTTPAVPTEFVPVSPPREPDQPKPAEPPLPEPSDDGDTAKELFEEARKRVATGRTDDAVALLRGIVDQFPRTWSAVQAKRTLAQLEDGEDP